MVNGAGSLGFLGAGFNMTVESLKETDLLRRFVVHEWSFW